MPDSTPIDLRDRIVQLEEFRMRAMRVAVRYSRNREDAEDAVQDSMLKTAMVPDFEIERAQSLLYAQVKWTCLDTIRANKRRERRDTAYFRADASSFGPEDDVCDRMAASWLAGNLPRLSPVEQLVLQMHADDTEVCDIAREIGLTYKGTHSALSRARRRMNVYWQSAMAGLGIAVLSLRARKAAVLAAFAASLGVAAVILPSSPAPTPADRDLAAIQVVDETQALPERVGSPSRPTAVAREGVAPKAPAPAVIHEVVVVPDIPGNVFVLDPLVVGTERASQELTESIASCLRNGIKVSLELIGCDDAAGR